MHRSRVDLPEPLGPMMQQISPEAISRSMLLQHGLGSEGLSESPGEDRSVVAHRETPSWSVRATGAVTSSGSGGTTFLAFLGSTEEEWEYFFSSSDWG